MARKPKSGNKTSIDPARESDTDIRARLSRGHRDWKMIHLRELIREHEMKPRPKIVMKKGFARNKPIRMKPRGLERLTGHSSLQIQEIHGGVIENTVSVPRCRSEIPEVRDYKQ